MWTSTLLSPSYVHAYIHIYVHVSMYIYLLIHKTSPLYISCVYTYNLCMYIINTVFYMLNDIAVSLYLWDIHIIIHYSGKVTIILPHYRLYSDHCIGVHTYVAARIVCLYTHGLLMSQFNVRKTTLKLSIIEPVREYVEHI